MVTRSLKSVGYRVFGCIFSFNEILLVLGKKMADSSPFEELFQGWHPGVWRLLPNQRGAGSKFGTGKP
jgi:hypothetical protein